MLWVRIPKAHFGRCVCFVGPYSLYLVKFGIGTAILCIFKCFESAECECKVLFGIASVDRYFHCSCLFQL